MTLILIWKNKSDIIVIADTSFSEKGRPGMQLGPKIFSVPMRATIFGSDSPAQTCSNMGFAFAGFTAAGQFTHAIASAGLQNLVGSEESALPTVEDVAAFYSRCAVIVVNEIRSRYAPADYTFEGVVFGWQSNEAVAYTFDVGIDSECSAVSNITPLDFAEYGMYAIGQGHEKIQEFIEKTAAEGRQASPYDALRSVIKDEEITAVGGDMQAAVAGSEGVELKPVLYVDETGLAEGGFMGVDLSELGTVGDFVPLSMRPVVLTKAQ